jgi:hypothetical protein
MQGEGAASQALLVLLQSSGEGKGAVIWSCSQAATSNSEFMKAA